MSAIIQTIDLSTITGVYTLLIPSQYNVNNVSWIDLLNQSPYNLIFQAGGLQVPIPAWDHYPIQIAAQSGPFWQPVSACQFPATISPTLLGNPGASLSTLLTVTIYSTGESPSSTIPRALNVQSYVPNTVNTNGGTVATSIQNDNKPPLTTIIESTPSDAVASTWHADNSGNLTIKGDNSGALTTLLETIAGASPLVRFFAGLIQMDTTGHIIMSNNITLRWLDSSLNSQAVLVATSSDEVHLRAVKSGGNVIIADSNDASIATFNSTSGMTLADGGVHLTTGSLSKISKFSAAISTTSTFFNHGLGVIPDIVLAIPNGAASTSSRTFEYESSTMTATQVKLTGGSSFTVDCLAIKF